MFMTNNLHSRSGSWPESRQPTSIAKRSKAIPSYVNVNAVKNSIRDANASPKSTGTERLSLEIVWN
jgi:hypothetical protein